MKRTGNIRFSLAAALLLATFAALASTAASAQPISGEAIRGEPFGVGRVTIPLPAEAADEAWRTNGLLLREADGRTCYPAFARGRVMRLLDNVLGDNLADPDAAAPNQVTVTFLFRGNAPLQLIAYTPAPQQFTLTPAAPKNPRSFQNLQTRWWRDYHALVREQIDRGDYPPLVETYLTAMLGRRLGLAAPLLSRENDSQASLPVETLQLLAGVESLRLDTLRQTAAAPRVNGEPTDQPLPAEIQWLPREFPVAAGEVAIEPLAMRVPAECFYLRFGRFDNLLWCDRLQKDYGGDIGRMLTLRGFELQLSDRMLQQLAVRQSALAETFGPAVVADVALIGRDLFLREGAAIGILMQARLPLLSADIDRQRQEMLAANAAAGAKLETVSIAGRDVSLLSTPDNRLRSFYAAQGNFHLVTSSREVMRRFLEVSGDETSSLGASDEFRHARTLLPLDREDTVFAYLSAAFSQGLLSPQYQIEMRRRLQAVTDIELLQLARLAAQAEQQPANSIADFVRGGFLPAGFGRRADGSGSMIRSGALQDSLRGARGHFTPIPDVELGAITASEARLCQEQADFYREKFPQFDPLLVGVKRFALNGDGLERVVIDGLVTPFAEEKYGWLTSLLGPPTRTRVVPADGDIVTIQAALKGGLLSPSVPPHQMFLGVQDTELPADLPPAGFLQTLRLLQTTPAYVGAWPKPGFLDFLPPALGGGAPDINGFSQLPLGLWRRQWDAFSAVALDPNLLAKVSPQLAIEETEDESQLRIHVGDLSQSKLRSLINELQFQRAYQASLGNARWLHSLTQQLDVPREEALATAEQLLDAKLTCTLGGQYELSIRDDGSALWVSTHWPVGQDGNAAGGDAPPPYTAPLLEWFRGADAGLTMYGDRVVTRAVIDLQRKPAEALAAPLPLFDLFQQFGKPAGKAAPPAAPKPSASAKPRDF